MEHSQEPSGSSLTLYDFNGADTKTVQRYGYVNYKWIAGPTVLNELFVQVGQTTFDATPKFNIPNITITGGFNLGADSDYPQGRTDWVGQILNHTTWTRDNHIFKAGLDYKRHRSDSFLDSNVRGTFTFPSLQRFIDGSPSRYAVRQGDTSLDRPNDLVSLYVQDDWRVASELTLNLGLRWDYETGKVEAVREIVGEPGAGVSRDRNNFGPRVGFVWAPSGTRDQALYGGAGVYYDQVILNVQGNARFTPPKVIGLQIDNPQLLDPLRGTSSIPPSDLSIVPQLTTPYNVNVSVGYRRELLRDVGIDVSLLHNRGYGQIMRINENLGRIGSATMTGTGAVRPDPTVGNKQVYQNIGEIRYTGLLVDVKKRFSRNFEASLAYTLSKTRDNGFNFLSNIIMPEHPELNWGPGTDDRRHRLSAFGIYRLPWDVQLATIVEYRSEAPLNITVGRDVNGDGATGDWVHESACVVINCSGFRYSRNSVREMTTEDANRLRTLFGLTPIAAFENNPKYFNTDVTLRKQFRVGGHTYSASLEAFNVFNIPQRNLPSENITSGTFGSSTSVSQPRAAQATFEIRF